MNNDSTGEEDKLDIIAIETVEGLDLLSDATLSSDWKDKITVKQFEGPKTWRLLKTNQDGEPNEETVYTVRGVLVEKSLPPITIRPRTTPAKYKFLRQSVTLHGAGTKSFEDSKRTMKHLHRLFDRSFEENRLEGLVENYATIELSNRYLTPKRDAPNSQHIGFDQLVDPKGILEEMSQEGGGFVHAEDNAVTYWQRKTHAEGGYKYSNIGPQAFRIGDIVESQMSLVVIPLKGDKFKMINVMRALTLLEAGTKQDDNPVEWTSQPTVTLKRKVGYGSEAETEVNKRMNVD